MVSNALSGRSYIGGPPAVCRIPPERGPWPPIGAPAIQLHGYANWTDFDPLAPYRQSAIFALQRVGPGNIYHGRSSASAVRVELDVDQIANTPYWNVTIRTFDPGQPPEEYTWHSVYVDPDQPFETRTLHHITIPGVDYQFARVTL